MARRFELPLRHPKKPVQKSRRPRNLCIPKRYHCLSRKRRLKFLSLRFFKRTSRHRIRACGQRDASAGKIHKLQPPDLTPPNEPPSFSPLPENVSITPLEAIDAERLPPPLIPLEGTTFHPSLEFQQPQVDQGDTANTPRSSQDEGFIDEGFIDDDSDYTLPNTDDEGDMENGRVYCTERKYHFPIDEQQQQIELDMHHMWKKHSPVGQRLSLAPVNTKKMNNILDIGSGACNWVDDIAERFPHTTVTAIDLFAQSRIQPPNITLQRDDVELPWPARARGKYEFIHSRDMILAIRDWDKLLKNAFHSLKSGGFIELQEIHYSLQSEDESLHSTAEPLANFFSTIAEGLKALGIDLHAITLLAEKMRVAGFVNVTTNRSYIPISRNTKSKTENDAATCMRSIIYDGLQGTALGPLTRGLGWGSQEVEVYLIGVRACLGELQDTKLPMYIIHAQRP